MIRKSPNPIIRPDDYYLWLSQTCNIYDCLIPDVLQLLTFTYGNEWTLCKDEFQFPQPDNGGQWPSQKPLNSWLERDAKAAIKKCARTRSDFSKVMHCIQEPKEALPDYIQRFIGVWDNNAGITREENAAFAIQTLLHNVKPHISSGYKLSCHDWQDKSWKSTVNTLLSMHRNQIFTQGGTGGSKQMVQSVNPNNNQQKNATQPQQSTKNKRKGNCRNCGRAGHWASECRIPRRPARYQDSRDRYLDYRPRDQYSDYPQHDQNAEYRYPALPGPPPRLAIQEPGANHHKNE